MTGRTLTPAWVLVTVAAATTIAWAQSSSLYLDQEGAAAQPMTFVNGVPDRLSPGVANVSMLAVQLPPPREFAVHDLVTIIVRESIQNESESEIDTEKDASMQAIISAFPDLRLKNLLDLQAKPSRMADGIPEVGMNFSGKFEGEGDYQRKDTFTTRLSARIIDVKPNGTLVLEARKFIQSDDESVDIVLTGTCRREDIAADNTVLSTQIYDLKLVKEHTGELRKATKKGLITRFFETLFNF